MLLVAASILTFLFECAFTVSFPRKHPYGYYKYCGKVISQLLSLGQRCTCAQMCCVTTTGLCDGSHGCCDQGSSVTKHEQPRWPFHLGGEACCLAEPYHPRYHVSVFMSSRRSTEQAMWRVFSSFGLIILATYCPKLPYCFEVKINNVSGTFTAKSSGVSEKQTQGV